MSFILNKLEFFQIIYLRLKNLITMRIFSYFSSYEIQDDIPA